MLEDSSDKQIAKKGWGIPGALFLGLCAYFLPQVVLIFFVPDLQALLLTQNATNFILIALFELLTIGVIIAFVRGYGLRLTDIGLKKFKLSDLGLALGGFVIYFIASIVISALVSVLIPFDQKQVQDIGFSNPQGLELVMVFVAIVILAPLAEELLFRGFIFQGIRRRLPFWPTAIIVSALFGLVHFQFNVGLDVFALSLVLCWLRERTGSLWPGILLHSAKNLVAFLLLFVFQLNV
jgi:membrane protease YdiL (CAAX protease family)